MCHCNTALTQPSPPILFHRIHFSTHPCSLPFLGFSKISFQKYFFKMDILLFLIIKKLINNMIFFFFCDLREVDFKFSFKMKGLVKFQQLTSRIKNQEKGKSRSKKMSHPRLLMLWQKKHKFDTSCVQIVHVAKRWNRKQDHQSLSQVKTLVYIYTVDKEIGHAYKRVTWNFLFSARGSLPIVITTHSYHFLSVTHIFYCISKTLFMLIYFKLIVTNRQ